MTDIPIGVMYRCDNPPENLPAYARLVERLDYDELWLVEDCFFAGAVSSVSVAAAVTERLRIGLGIMPAAFRNPALAAMELANLARMFPGRILPGFGHGMADWVQQVGAGHPSPLAVLGETVEAVRTLLAGETVSAAGRHVRLDQVALAYPPTERVPIATGVRNARSLHLSGQVADGTILAECASPAYVRWAREQIEQGRRAAGRTDPHRVTVYAFFDFDASRAGARWEIARLFSAGQAPAAADADLAEEITALRAATGDDVDALAAALPESYVDRFAVAGSAAQCSEALAALAAAGADAVVLVPHRDPQLAVAQLTLAAPHLR